MTRAPAGVLPLLAALVACAPEHPPLDPRLLNTELRAFTSADGGATWALYPEVMARGIDSLGLAVRDDGSLWVTGHDHATEPPAWERYLGPKVRGLRFDGTRWTRADWRPSGGDALAFIDPQWFGDELWYISRQDNSGGDPAEFGGATEMRSTPDNDVLYSAVGLADPMPVWFRGERHVFATQLRTGVVHLVGDPLRHRRQFGGKTVPFATVIGDTLWLLAQAAVDGRRYPVYTTTTDGETWSEWRALLPRSEPMTCTSPVLGPLGEDGLVLLCVDERPGMAGQGERGHRQAWQAPGTG